MAEFMTEDFLLSTQTAKRLYHDYAEKMPIIDYHCHVSPREIYEDRRFDNITEVWLGGDHYKWRLMRSNGVKEEYITGDADPKEKFRMFAAALEKAIGNPMYHWCHLELKRYFGYDGILSADTADEVWEKTKAVLAEKDMTVRGIIKKSGVRFIGTTDDPTDTLKWHQKLAADSSFDTVVAPTFRPDKAFQLSSPTYGEYIEKLSDCSGIRIDSVASLKAALTSRMAHFAACGCRASDHGINYIVYVTMSERELDSAFKKALAGEAVSQREIDAFQTEMHLFCAEKYCDLGWVMQIHYNCLRNTNTKMFRLLGPDTGYDCIGPHNDSQSLAKLLDEMNSRGKLPRLVLYSLDPGENAFLDTLIGAFQAEGYPGTVQHGSAWWFNDTKNGMRQQLMSLASLGLLGNFIGMLTDSRSFLSYTRHEYFRRILCGLLGEWVENGEYPSDMKSLGKIVEDISYNNAKRFFSLEV